MSLSIELAPYIVKPISNKKKNKSFPISFVKILTEDDESRKKLTLELSIKIYYDSKNDDKRWMGKHDWKEEFVLDEGYEGNERNHFILKMTDLFESALEISNMQYLASNPPKNRRKSLQVNCSLDGRQETSRVVAFSTTYNRDWTELLNRGIFVWRQERSYRNFNDYHMDERLGEYVVRDPNHDNKDDKKKIQYKDLTKLKRKRDQSNSNKPYKKNTITREVTEDKRLDSKQSTPVLLHEEEKRTLNKLLKEYRSKNNKRPDLKEASLVLLNEAEKRILNSLLKEHSLDNGKRIHPARRYSSTTVDRSEKVVSSTEESIDESLDKSIEDD